MTETLLSLSNVLLFGRVVENLEVTPTSTTANNTVDVTERERLDPSAAFANNAFVDGVVVADGLRVLVRRQTQVLNGIYTITFPAGVVTWTRATIVRNNTVFVREGSRKNRRSVWSQTVALGGPGNQRFRRADRKGLGQNSLLDAQLEDARFARIYGFSYEGTYYELPNPTLFLVHGDGESATDNNAPTDPEHASRAPFDPSLSGVGAADFQIADNIRVWNYDKADYTIRMDVETGMIEQVLLNVFFEVEAPMLAGGRVAGGRVAGGRVAGGRVAGGRVAGGRVSGGRVGGSSD